MSSAQAAYAGLITAGTLYLVSLVFLVGAWLYEVHDDKRRVDRARVARSREQRMQHASSDGMVK